MTTKTFIEKAVEGGWNEHLGIELIELLPSVFEGTEARFHVEIEGEDDTLLIAVSDVLLETLAWQAVGKVEGWDLCDCPDSQPSYFHTDYCSGRKWLTRMHRMIDHLAKGGTITTYLETL